MAIEISSATEFMNMANWDDKGSSSSIIDVILTDDIDFSEVEEWGGYGSTTFYINFDGQGHTIKNLVTSTNSTFCFFHIGQNSTVKNVRFSNNHITSTNVIAFIWCEHYITLSDIIIDNTNTIVTTSDVYPIKGTEYGCNTNKVSISGAYRCANFYGIYIKTGNYLGGLVKNSNVVATVTSKYFQAFQCNTAINCYSRCDITITADSYTVIPFYDGWDFFCYAANKVTDNGYTAKYLEGCRYPSYGTAIECYYDNELLPASVGDSSYGQPTENLKSKAWLRSHNWAI